MLVESDSKSFAISSTVLLPVRYALIALIFVSLLNLDVLDINKNPLSIYFYKL